MMKNYFIAALLLCSSALSAMAQDGKLNVLYVDGTKHEVLLKDVAKLTVSGGNVSLLGGDGATVANHNIADIERIDLTASTAGISTSKANKDIKLSANGYTITAEGLTDGKYLEVYTAGGKLISKAIVKGGKAMVDVASVKNGVYVVKADGKSLKMVKK